MAEVEPATAIKTLRDVVRRPGVLIDSAQFAEDLANLRLAYTNDAKFASAVGAIAHAVVAALRQREAFGTKLTHQLGSYYRAKFQSERKQGSPADLRLVFRPVPTSGEVEIVAFGNRFDPDSIYRAAQFRAAQFQINRSGIAGSAAASQILVKAASQAIDRRPRASRTCSTIG